MSNPTRRNFLKASLVGIIGLSGSSFSFEHNVEVPKKEYSALDLYGGKEAVMERVRSETVKELKKYRDGRGIMEELENVCVKAAHDSDGACMLLNGAYRALDGEKFTMLYFRIINKRMCIDIPTRILGDPKFRDRAELAYWNNRRGATRLRKYIESETINELNCSC